MTSREAVFLMISGCRFRSTPIPWETAIPHHRHSTTCCRRCLLLIMPPRPSDFSVLTALGFQPRARRDPAPQIRTILPTTASKTLTGLGAVPTQAAHRKQSSREVATFANTSTGTENISSVATKAVRRRPKEASPARKIVHGTRRSTTPGSTVSGKVAAAFLVGSIT